MTTVLKVKNGAIRLPSPWQKSWRQAEVLVFPSEDTLIFKKVQAPSGKLSAIAGRISARPLSAAEINKEIAAYRQKK